MGAIPFWAIIVFSYSNEVAQNGLRIGEGGLASKTGGGDLMNSWTKKKLLFFRQHFPRSGLFLLLYESLFPVEGPGLLLLPLYSVLSTTSNSLIPHRNRASGGGGVCMYLYNTCLLKRYIRYT